MKEYIRFVDKVTVKGSTQPIDIFTFDVDLSDLKVVEAAPSKANEKLLKYIKRKKLKEQYNKILQKKFRIYSHYSHDTDIQLIRRPYTEVKRCENT